MCVFLKLKKKKFKNKNIKKNIKKYKIKKKKKPTAHLGTLKGELN